MYVMYVCTYVRTYLCMYVCNVRTYLCMYVCMYVCLYIRTFVCMYVFPRSVNLLANFHKDQCATGNH